MKKTFLSIVLAAVLISFSSCSSKQDNSDVTEKEVGTTTAAAVETEQETKEESEEPTMEKSEYTVLKSSEAITLNNKMTPFERAYVKKRPFSLLDKDIPEPDVRIGNAIVTKEAIIALYQSLLECRSISEEEYQEEISRAEDYSYTEAILNGVNYSNYIPPKGYDGGKLDVGEDISFNNKEDFFDLLEDSLSDENEYSAYRADCILKQARDVFNAVINGTYTELPDRNKNYLIPFAIDDPYTDYRSSWEYDSAALEDIKDHIDEYIIYDEQLGLEFLVHVTLPPGYDEAKTYPVFFMTDGVWRLNDHAALYKAMANNEAADVILVSLAYNYNIKGTEDQFRNELFIANREGLLNFLTDDLMPYLGELYNIDYNNSTLFGHSMGGVFSHYALFQSDKYENQPFFRYIIGSPAMFNLYSTYDDYDAEGGESEYGYFDRHDSLDKKVFLCGGSLEDPDYSTAYHGHDSLLTGLRKMKGRISSHNADITYKLYESHHYQYVPSMLLEFLKEEYPVD